MNMTHLSVYLPSLIVAQDGAAGTGPSMVGVPAPASQPATGTTTTGTAQPVGPTGAPPPASPFGGGQFLFIMLAMLGLMVFMSFWTNRKEKKRREELMNSMKKGDKVQTLGGILGTVQEVFDNEVVLRLEEGRVRVARSSIQTILKPSDSRPGDRGSEVELKNSREKAVV